MDALDITAIELPTPFRIGPVTVYLLEGDVPTLIDAGPRWPPALETLEAKLALRGLEVADLAQILLTHQHHDHIGLANTLQRRSGASVAVIGQLANYLAAYPDSNALDDEYALAVMQRYGIPTDAVERAREISRTFWRFSDRVVADRILEEDEVVTAGSRRLRVVTRPGHSPTDTLFVDDTGRLAFVGDHLLARISSNPVIHRPLGSDADLARRQSTLATYLDSLARTQLLDVDVMLAGHGPTIGDAATLIQQRLDHHAERKAVVLELIRRGSTTTYELVVELWGLLEASQIYLGVSEVVGHTDLLCAEGRLLEVARADDSIEFALPD